MKYYILTIFPELFTSFISTSIIGRAVNENTIDIEVIDFRKYSKNKHKKVDDTIYGGGSGMLLQVEPIDLAIQDIISKSTKKLKKIYMSPRGKVLNQIISKKLASIDEDIVILCGHYEGVDQRLLELYNFEEISIGDYVLTGGELPAMVMIDCITRLIDGVITKESLNDESFEHNLLEYPQYTKPAEYKGMKVPEVLISGNHKNIKEYNKEEAIYVTYKNRKDLLRKAIKGNITQVSEVNKIRNKKEGK